MTNKFEKNYMELEDIKGLTLWNIKISEDSSYLYILLKNDRDEVLFLSYLVSSCGGYNAWITGLDGREQAIGNKVMDVIEHDMNLPESEGVAYNFEIVTAKGACVIDFRSDCNGYYGAGLRLVEIKKDIDFRDDCNEYFW